jgi:hypothetical protein
VPAQAQWTHVQRLSLENKGVSPCIPLLASYRSKNQGLIQIWLYLILLATSSYCYMTFPSLVLHDLPHVQISQVLCLCYAIPTSLLCHPYLPATFSGLRPSLFSSDLPPCYSATCRWWLVVTIIATSIGFDTSRDNVSVKLLLLMVG